MAQSISIADEALIALDTLAGRATSLFNPSLRLGVTGLSRAGKTVFISSLVHNLIAGGRLPMFEAAHKNRIARAFIEPQPDDGVPRFAYEDHISALINERIWPASTRAISQLRLTIEFESAQGWGKYFSAGKLHLDIVDYPGEWLLDLPLLTKNYATFSREAIELARDKARKSISKPYLALVEKIDPAKPADESDARMLAEAFTDYLRAGRSDALALSTLPPGRFLMPGDMEGSPALTFAPLVLDDEMPRGPNTLYAMMERRYEAYKSLVVKPFFRDHITRLDRQIVLIDAMSAINAGSDALIDLRRALTEILSCFRQGTTNPINALFTRRIDRILVAATKADHLHHESHDRLERIVRALVDQSIERARFTGAQVDTLALAAIRSTREASVDDAGEPLPVVVGTPIKGETIGDQTFDGKTETAIFPGDLPTDIAALMDANVAPGAHRFVRFVPPKLETTAEGLTLSLPHIRLDKAMQFLIGDQLA